ncbi:Brassinosteroid LRR receptor kinase BRL2 [Vitis vinifera]|uniref:Brassinosteroid LRR receptor kinase BRL2 n=1 Tax=Vitis vinifera TaxID=29760 RepID=A0A438HGW8_VITVI|nr:Brassinosteroid LRR receptor kinase BRL2 [Vitis vinifera]
MGKLPNWLGELKNLRALYLSNNEFEGPIPASLGTLQHLESLDLGLNEMNGSIPDSIGQLSQLEQLDVSSNHLSGSLQIVNDLDMGSCHLGPSFPAWLQSQKNLQNLGFSNCSISSPIPNWFWNISFNLQRLNLSDNQLQGAIPSNIGESLPSLHFLSLSGLEVLDLSYNKLLGEVPAWIGAAFVNLVILNLRSNVFCGRLPSQLSNLSSLHVLDIAQNNLMGKIPITLVELKAMAQEQLIIYGLNVTAGSLYEERLVVIAKGQSLEYTKTLSLVVGIDLSDNNLSGEFPQEITKLFGLVFLNLSRNHITGQIPESISMLRQLSSLDLSSNKLSGTIPSSMASLSFLSYLNLSNNNFYGEIPFIGQMATFTELAFVGNPDLCGAPLAINARMKIQIKGKVLLVTKMMVAILINGFT